MALLILKVILFRKKKKVLLNFAFFSFFVYFLPTLINARSLATLSVFEENVIEIIVRASIWFEGLDSVLWQVLIEFLFVVFLLFFFNRIKN